MSSTNSYKFEEDAQVAFRSILHLSANYRSLQERCDIQEETIRELTEQLKFAENTPASVTKVYIPTVSDISNNKVAPETLAIINEPTTIGPLECKILNPSTIDCSNILQDKWDKTYFVTKVVEAGKTISRNPHINRV